MIAAVDRQIFYREVSKLLQAGFPIDKAATTLLHRASHGGRRRLVEALRSGLGNGRTIAESLQPEITEMEFSVLDSTERGGQLADGCAHLADYFALQAQTRARIFPRLIYPALLLHLAFLPGAVPRLFSDGAGGFLRALLGPILAVYALVALLVVGFRHLARRGQTDPLCDRLVNAIPLAGSMRRSLALSRFCKILEISLLAGRKPSDAVNDAAGAANAGLISRAARKICPQLAAGEALGPQLLESDAFPGELADALANAEAGGTLEKESGRWAGYLQAEANQTADRVAEWAPRVVYAIAVVVAVWAILKGAMNYFNTITGLLPT
jgi:type II secretory pathway component PulF